MSAVTNREAIFAGFKELTQEITSWKEYFVDKPLPNAIKKSLMFGSVAASVCAYKMPVDSSYKTPLYVAIGGCATGLLALESFQANYLALDLKARTLEQQISGVDAKELYPILLKSLQDSSRTIKKIASDLPGPLQKRIITTSCKIGRVAMTVIGGVSLCAGSISQSALCLLTAAGFHVLTKFEPLCARAETYLTTLAAKIDRLATLCSQEVNQQS